MHARGLFKLLSPFAPVTFGTEEMYRRRHTARRKECREQEGAAEEQHSIPRRKHAPALKALA